MRFYTKADAELAASLRQQIYDLQESNRVVVRELDQSRKETIAALDRLAEAKAAPVQPKAPMALTLQQAAQRLRIPEELAGEVDFERLGMQVQRSRHQ